MDRTRREFLADVGRGMLVASVGAATAAELALVPAAFADDKKTGRLSFGSLEPLAGLMQDTPADKQLPLLVKKLRDGTSFRELVAAGALANARQFGGQDYVGWHTFMALAPAFEMAKELPEPNQALPILKVLYRNAQTMQGRGGHGNEVLKPIEPRSLPEGRPGSAAARGHWGQGHGRGRRHPDRPGAPQARGCLQRPAVSCRGGHLPGCRRYPLFGPGLAGLGDARPDRQGTCPDLVAAVGSLLLERGAEDRQRIGAEPPQRAAALAGTA